MRVLIIPAWAVGVALLVAPPALYHAHFGVVWLWMSVGMPEPGAHIFAFGVSFGWAWAWLMWSVESKRVFLTTALQLPRVETRETDE
jgi:hypothetical protein